MIKTLRSKFKKWRWKKKE